MKRETGLFTLYVNTQEKIFLEKCGELWGNVYLCKKFNRKKRKNMRFTGSIDAKTDEKGRVFVPSVFRKVLQKEGEEGFVLRRDLFEPCLVLYPRSVWDARVDAIRARTNPFDRNQQRGLRLFTADAENITLDSSGRMLIPRRFLEHAGIKSDVRFNGMDDTIEIWSKQAAENLLSNPEEVGNILEEMMKDPASF